MSGEVSFGVLLCTHNGERFLDAQLRSLADQSHRAARVEVHDWDSRDGTIARIEAWIDTGLTGAAARLVRHDRAPGARDSFLEALSLFLRDNRTSHVLFCDQDDVWHPKRLARYAQVISEQGSDLIFSDVELIDASGRRLAPSLYRSAGTPYRSPVSLDSDDLAIANPAVGMTLCLSRRLAMLLVEHRGAPWPMHDWAAALLCRIYGLNSAFMPEVLGAYRQHPKNQRGAPSIRQVAKRLARIRSRRRQLQQLAAWAESLGGEPRKRARQLFASSRRACAGAILRSNNLRAWYRLVLILTVCTG